MMWPCRHIQQKRPKAKESISTEVEVATTNRMVEETKSKETCRIKEDHTKATKEVVLQIEEEVVVENLIRVTFNVTIVRNMDIIRVIVHKNERIKKVMQSLQNMKKKR